MERRHHKSVPNQISVKEKLRPKVVHGAKLLKPVQTDFAACKQTGPHNDNQLPHFLSEQEEERIKGEKVVDIHARRL